MFRVRTTKYKGRNIILSDGTEIHKNDLLLKIHLHNVTLIQQLSKYESEFQKGKKMIKDVLNSMPLLAQYLKNHPKAEEIKGIIGITLINKGHRILGFDQFSPYNKVYFLFKKLTLLPIYFISATNFSLTTLKKHQPVYLMMSKEKLLATYSRAEKR